MNGATSTTTAPAMPDGGGHDGRLLAVTDLRVDFATDGGTVKAVRGIDFELDPSDSVAILGESGSGKTVTGKSLMGLVDRPGRVRGSIMFNGQELVGLGETKLRDVRGPGMAMVFQDSLDALNPVYTVGSQLVEVLRVRLGWSRRQAREEAIRLMETVGINSAAERVNDFPHQFSGGMRQRICIAMAIALKPKLLIADEPTTALDVTVQAGILRLLAELQRESGMALVFVTHDLSVARSVARKLIVMYAGKIVEQGPLEEIFAKPAHPYTKALLSSHPGAAKHWTELHPIPGEPPDKLGTFTGCAFEPRCALALRECATDRPELLQVSSGRSSRCIRAKEVLDGLR
jgi:oligopeptide transport system ATP-binding protein